MPKPSDIQAAISLMRLHQVDAMRLGELVSLAARIEPELLRTVRLELTPFDAGAEADLWFSPLIETRTADWIVLAPAAARELQFALAIDPSRLDAAHALILEAHNGAPATIILEEEIAWLALNSLAEAQAAIESRLRLVLGKLLEDPVANLGLAHWFAGAARRLPQVAQATEAYALLSFVASGLLDGRRVTDAELSWASLETLAGIWPTSIPKLRLWATLTDYGLSIRANRAFGFVPLELPRTDPLLLELRQVNEPRQLIALRRGETRTVQTNSGAVELHTAAGDAYRLRHRPKELASSNMRGLMLGFGGTGAHILTALKEQCVLKHGRVPDTLKFLLFDTIADWQPGMAVQVVGGPAEEKLASSYDEAASMDPLTEYFYLRDFDPDLKSHVFDLLSPKGNADAYPHLKDWLHASWFSENIPAHQLNVRMGAAQQRQIGRYAMFKNAEMIVARLRPLIRNVADNAKGADVDVWLISSAAGGTGAGCLIDAAYLTRLAAADNNLKVKITGVIVLPNVYMNVRGISRARAYSLLRELDRVQEQGIPHTDRYVDMKKREMVSSRVVYDKNEQQVVLCSGRLFDDLFYLSSDCATETDRRKFFTSVASAIDPYLDANSGKVLLEQAVNETAAASSFGAASFCVPTNTFAQIFAWEQVAEYLRRATAPREVGDRVEGLYSGASYERADSATERVGSLLQLFRQLLFINTWSDQAQEAFARHELDAERIVKVFYELIGSNHTPEEQAVLLAYINPLSSLKQSESIPELEIKTFKENVKSKETQEESRYRFADRLEEVLKRYTNPAGGDHTFEKGRRHVFKAISNRLRKKVDDLFIAELELRRIQFAQRDDEPEQGTVLTQLFDEVNWMLSDEGPVRRLQRIIERFIIVVAREEPIHYNNYRRALQELYKSRRIGWFSFGAWVEPYQETARENGAVYIRWYQKHELLKDLQLLVLGVERRLREWERMIAQLFDVLVRREGSHEGEASALFTVTQLHLKGTLEARLQHAVRNRSLLISFGPEPDPQMHGYKDELRNQSARGLATSLLDDSYWEAALTDDGAPELTLVINSLTHPEQRYSTREIRRLLPQLYQFFYQRIDERLRYTDVFDYLLWLRDQRGVQPSEVVRLLDAEATTLIDAGGVPERRTLIYREPEGGQKKELVDSIALKLGNLEGIERYSSDRNAITLIKIKKPDADENVDIQDCLDDYSLLRVDHLNNDEAHDSQLRRAQGFHPFRQELEAWYIERSYIKELNSLDVPMLPPRVVRLLEDPDMMQIFVHCIATGAVERIEGKGWLWHAPDGDVVLTDDDPSVDVIRAAVNFVLRQGEGWRTGLIPIRREVARQTVVASAQKKGWTPQGMIAEFMESKVDPFLAANAPASLRLALKMVFTFYCNPQTNTDLRLRVNLP